MGFQKTTIKGFAYGFSGKAAIRALGIVKISLLARILNPRQFGLFGIASLMLALLETLTETGVNVVLIQGKKELKDYVDSAWLISIIRGFLIFLLIIGAKPVIINFFNEPAAAALLNMIALVPLIKGFINPAIISFRKDLLFDKEYKLRTALFFLESAVSVGASLLLGSAVGIIYGLIFGAVVEVAYSHIYLSPKPRLTYSLVKIKEIVGAGKWVNLTGVASYVSSEGDDFFVGRLLQTASLGIYQGIYKIAILPLTEIAWVSTQVTLPVYSQISHDKVRLRRAFTKIALVQTLLAGLFGLAIYLFAYQIVYLLLGASWLSGVGVLKVLAIYGVIKALLKLSTALLYSLKDQRAVAFFSILEMSLLLVSIVPAIRNFGLVGAAYACILSVAVVFPIAGVYVYRKLF